MIATHNQQASTDDLSPPLPHEVNDSPEPENDIAISVVKNSPPASQLLLPSRIVTHTPKAGLNPLVDAAGYLFSVLGKLKQLKSYRQLNKLQKELIQEINTFQEAVKNQGYNAEYIVVCRYAICATFDDLISNTVWGGHGQWDSFSLLATFNQDTQHQDKFFTILERAIKEPALYIDLMELMYICLSMGYKGQYRSTEHSQFQLDQITNSLYKHIRAYRGSFSKTLSPTPLKAQKSATETIKERPLSLLFIFFITGCIIMTIFISLGYLMDVISNEAYKHITQIEDPVSDKTYRQ
ncbi:type IVB secretion system protein IcmH/DotU [Aquicella lusitana]|uniref:Type VI secretion system protein ImpK n=1 Tax=Aquicella lusitana TaxID=254246 RepID=A0A370GYA4_9COXI|nr:type IVB secretion system protein IcmH/DotU [Aquicella lusitana]RDI48628.1 type VI secretion system protein ImpK [Aquicella lusitana]VVC73995.1 hypothetical protein AQULUS_17570 [Aquicella lusitana]